MPESDVMRVAIIAERVMEMTEGYGVDLDLLRDSASCINEGKLFILIVDHENDKISTNYYTPQ